MAPQEAAGGAPGPRLFTWDEIELHSKRGDAPHQEKWLVIERKVYDVRRFASLHPGGSRILNSHVGEDATVSFRGRVGVAGFQRA